MGMDDSLKTAFEHILGAINELKNSSKADIDALKTSNSKDIEEIKKSVQAMVLIVTKLGLSDFSAGSLVDKTHCKTIALSVTENNDAKHKETLKSVDKRLVWVYTLSLVSFTAVFAILGFFARQIF